jgi:hypothetical protein
VLVALGRYASLNHDVREIHLICAEAAARTPAASLPSTPTLFRSRLTKPTANRPTAGGGISINRPARHETGPVRRAAKRNVECGEPSATLNDRPRELGPEIRIVESPARRRTHDAENSARVGPIHQYCRARRGRGEQSQVKARVASGPNYAYFDIIVEGELS